MTALLGWIKARLNLCDRKQGHFRRTFRAFYGGRYCADCWQHEMTFLPTSTRAWRIEKTGVSQ